MTDAKVDKTGAWLLARAASTGIARAVDPAHTSVDGDASYVVASGHRGRRPARPRGRRPPRRQRGDPRRRAQRDRAARLPDSGP
jgi:L-aminopeptidase/D-esterase-like protein